MNIDQTTKIITSRPQSFLDIGIIEGGEKKLIHRKYDASNGNWKKLIADVFTDFGVPSVFIDIYAPNGSSFKLVQSVTLNNDGSYLQQQPQFPMAGLGAAPTQIPDHFTAYVLREKDEKIREREDRILELKDQHKLDQDTIRELREKNWELEKAAKFMQKEFELQRAEENLQRENDRKGSLEGIAETVMANDKLMDIAHALIMSKIQQQPQQVEASGMTALDSDPSISEGKKQIIREIAEWLKMQHDATASKIYAIFNQLAMNPKTIDKLINDFSNEPVQKANNH